jgi:hypothetical protein
MRATSFRYCMMIGAAALAGVALYYAVSYVGVSSALTQSLMVPFYQSSIRALWLAFCIQSLLLAMCFMAVAYRPQAISREIVVIFGLLQLVESVILFALASSTTVVVLLGIAALFVLLGTVLWPMHLTSTTLGKVVPPVPGVAQSK